MIKYFSLTHILAYLAPILICIYSKKLAYYFNLLDSPDNLRKFHKEITPLTGGIIVFSSLFIFVLYDFFSFSVLNAHNFIDYKSHYSLLIGCIIFFIIGIVDDKINLKPNIKLFLFIFAITFLLSIDYQLNLKILYISVIQSKFSIGNFSYFWTILCFLLFINALNMFDGINLQVGLYSILSICYLIFFYKFLDDFLIITLFSLICFSVLNFSSKCFLGNSGSYFLGFLLGYVFVKNYNLNQNIYADEVVLMMIIPGIDMMRLFFQRIIKKKHPFSPDRNHIHHILLNKFNKIQTVLIIVILIWVPFFLAKLTNLFFIFILLQFIIYTFLIIKFKT